jgi:hypothetical protein
MDRRRFLVETRSRTLRLVACTPADAETWVWALQKAIDLQTRPSTPTKQARAESTDAPTQDHRSIGTAWVDWHSSRSASPIHATNSSSPLPPNWSARSGQAAFPHAWEFGSSEALATSRSSTPSQWQDNCEDPLSEASKRPPSSAEHSTHGDEAMLEALLQSLQSSRKGLQVGCHQHMRVYRSTSDAWLQLASELCSGDSGGSRSSTSSSSTNADSEKLWREHPNAVDDSYEQNTMEELAANVPVVQMESVAGSAQPGNGSLAADLGDQNCLSRNSEADASLNPPSGNAAVSDLEYVETLLGSLNDRSNCNSKEPVLPWSHGSADSVSTTEGSPSSALSVAETEGLGDGPSVLDCEMNLHQGLHEQGLARPPERARSPGGRRPGRPLGGQGAKADEPSRPPERSSSPGGSRPNRFAVAEPCVAQKDAQFCTAVEEEECGRVPCRTRDEEVLDTLLQSLQEPGSGGLFAVADSCSASAVHETTVLPEASAPRPTAAPPGSHLAATQEWGSHNWCQYWPQASV